MEIIQNVQWLDFLGVKTAFSKGPEKFLRKYQVATAYMKIQPVKEIFGYERDFELFEEQTSDGVLKWYADQLTKQILNAPQHWLWSHNRWKRKYEAQIAK